MLSSLGSYLRGYVGSNNPLGIDSGVDKVPFYSYFFVKDLFAFFRNICSLFSKFIRNYLPVDPMQTPARIVPEWYFLPFYAILRSIPDKLGGVLLRWVDL